VNIVLVLIDSLNRRHLSCYAPQAPAATPNIDGLARRGVRFDNHFVASLPCMPARRDLFTGRKEFLWRPWGPLESWDARLPRMLAGHGYSTRIVTDHYHYWEEEGNGYVQSFQSTDLIRGHEIDFWKTPAPPDERLPRWAELIERWRPTRGRQYYANVREFTVERDFFAPRVFSQAADWILTAASRHQPFYLQVESFDVHEPFHVPEPYRSLFGDPDGDDVWCIWPPYQDAAMTRRFMESTTAQELELIRARYAAKVAMVDRWLGVFIDALDQRDLLDSTLIILTTDHGHDLAERGRFGKSFPHYDDHANIPLLIVHPDGLRGRSTGSLTSAIDLFPTIMEAAGAAPRTPIDGVSLMPLATRADASPPHHRVTYGTYGQGIAITDGEWSLMKTPVPGRDLFSYSSLLFKSMMTTKPLVPVAGGYFIPGVELPQWKAPVEIAPPEVAERIRSGRLPNVGHACMDASPVAYTPEPVTDMLFDRRRDPTQRRNLWMEAGEQRDRLLKLLRHTMKDERIPTEQYDRLGI
jgi:arylsulfatase A-like enzyme